jgi:hypothetical protein
MSITWKTITSPRGVVILRSLSSGTLTVEDAANLEATYVKGGPYYGYPFMGVVEPGVHFTPEFRRYFSREFDKQLDMPGMAFVVSNGPVRMVVSFIVLIAQKVNGLPMPIKFFGDESSAMAWLESRVEARSGRSPPSAGRSSGMGAQASP